MSVHIYPEKGKVDDAIEVLKKFAVGKPVVVEETFNLTCSTPELEEFLAKSRPIAAGWMGHYDGMPIDELEALKQKKTITISQAIYLDFLDLFRRMGPK